MVGMTSSKKWYVPPYRGPTYHTGRSAPDHASRVVLMAAMPLANRAESSLSSHAASLASAIRRVGLPKRL